MSHEVRMPLTVVIGYADLLRGQLKDDKAGLLTPIYDAGRRLQRTLESVFELARLEGGAYELRLEPLPLDSLAQEVVQDLSIEAEKRDIA